MIGGLGFHVTMTFAFTGPLEMGIHGLDFFDVRLVTR